MDAKEYMEQVRKIDRMISNKTVELEQWWQMAMSVTPPMDGQDRVQASGSQQKMADAIDRFVDIQREIDADIERLTATKQEVIRTIEQLPVAEYDVLHKIYIQFKDLKEVAVESGNVYSWATTVHGRALKNLQKLLDQKEGESYAYKLFK